MIHVARDKKNDSKKMSRILFQICVQERKKGQVSHTGGWIKIVQFLL